MSRKNKPRTSENRHLDGNKTFHKITQWIIKNPTPIISTVVTFLLTVMGKFNDIIEFAQRWPTYNTVIILSIFGFIYFALLFLFIYILINPPKNNLMISKKVAQWGLIALTMVALSAWGYSVWQNKALDNKVIVLVANFEGSNQDDVRITEMILEKLRQSTKEYDDTLIIPLKASISEQDGSQLAENLGKKYHADLVLWGWYGVSDTDILVTIHIENLSKLQSINFNKSQAMPLPSSQMYSPQALITELGHYSFQRRLSDEMTSFVLFVMGAIRYDAKDYQTANKLFSDTLDNLDQSPLVQEGYILERSLVHILRGNTYLFTQKYDDALDDYSQALDSNYAYAAYSNRGFIYMLVQKDLEKALADLTKAISISPSDAERVVIYNNRATDYILLGESQKALDDLNNGIRINPEIAYLYLNRAQVYVVKGDYEQASSNITSALALDANLYFAYHVRCLVNLHKQDYDNAISNCTRYIKSPASKPVIINQNKLISITYNNRGMAYFLKKLYQEAIDDFSNAISVDPDLAVSYWNRGNAYFETQQYRSAVDDYSTALEKGISSFGGKSPTFKVGEITIILGEGQMEIEDFVYFNRGQAYLGLGQIDMALSDFKTLQKNSRGAYIQMLVSQELKKLGVKTEP